MNSRIRAALLIVGACIGASPWLWPLAAQVTHVPPPTAAQEQTAISLKRPPPGMLGGTGS